MLDEPQVKTLLYLADLLEMCQFKVFWQQIHAQVHWYKSYSGGRWTWPTPLKFPESKSKSKSPSPTRRSRVGLGDLDLDEGDLS